MIMYDCNVCAYPECICKRVVSYKEYLDGNGRSPMIFGMEIMRDLLDAIDYILNKVKNIEEVLDYSKLLEPFSEIILEEYIDHDNGELCYLELAILLREKYGEMISKEISFRYTNYSSMDTFFIYILRFLYGQPNDKNNYLIYGLRLEDEYFKKHLKRQEEHWKAIKIKRNFIKTLRLIIQKKEILMLEEKLKQKYVGKRKRINSEKNNRPFQNDIREYLIKYNRGCAVCGNTLKEVLEACHIKPDALCDENESVCIFNYLLLCCNHHKLFDSNMIYFEDDGTIVISEDICEEDRNRLFLDKNKKIKILEESIPFLQERRRLLNKDKIYFLKGETH